MLSDEENLLIKIQTLFFFAGSLASIFLQVFLFKLAGFGGVVLFDLLQFTFLLIFYTTSGWTLRKFSSRTLIRVGLVIFSLGWSLLAILKQESVHYIVPLGIIFGTGYGNYWSGFNLSQYILTHQQKREYFFGKSNAFVGIATGLGPIIGGTVILWGNTIFQNSFSGYYILFLIVFLLNLFIFLLASTLPRHTGIEFSLDHVLKHQRSFNWKLVLCQQFSRGLWDVAFGTLSAILLFLIIRQETILGAVQTSISLLMALFSLLAGKVLIRQRKFFLFGALLTSLGILFFGLWQNWLGILFMALLTGIGLPFLNIASSVAILNTIDEDKDPWERKYHLLLERDSVLGIARIISYLVLYFLFLNFDKILIAQKWMITIAIFPLILGFLLLKMRVKFLTDI